MDGDIEKLTVEIDVAGSKSTKLKEEVNELQKELGTIAKEQAEMDKIRNEEQQDYVTAKTNLEQGLAGVRKTSQVLRNYEKRF